jgi:arylformamidase
MASTDEFIEREYNNRALVPEHPAFFARWEKDSAYVRRTLECETDVAYGPDPRHRMDLFPALAPRGTLVFIHGGYWRSLDKSVFSWLAAPFVAAGIGVAMPNYRLAPLVRIDDIVEDAIAAMNWLMLNGVKHRLATQRSSYPGTGWRPPHRGDPGHALVEAAVRSGSHRGRRSHQRHLRFRAASPPQLQRRLFPTPTREATDLHTRAATPRRWWSRWADPRAGIHPPSRLLAHAWRGHVKSLLVLPGYNHFSVVDAFAERGQPLHQATLGLL